MAEIFLIGHGFMLYDNVDGASAAPRTFSKPGNVDIVFYVGPYVSAYGPTTLVAVARNVASSNVAAIADRVDEINMGSDFDRLSETPEAPTDCTAVLAEANAPNHFLRPPEGRTWEAEYIRVLQGWHRPQGWFVMEAGDFPTCRAQYGDRAGVSLSSIAMYCARTYDYTVIHWLVCREPLQTTPCLPPESPLKAPVHQQGQMQGVRDKVDKYHAFSQTAKSFGNTLRSVYKYQALGAKWVSFELKYFVISELSTKVLGGGDAMRLAAAALLDETDLALAQDRRDHDLLKRFPQLPSQLDPKIPEILQTVEGLRKLLSIL